ncbi:MAG TPA: fumarylacetoacetase [Flavobacteriales bacterium]|nr:fumarylacetoacetase [Flavobacteriales bacterium]HMR27778.1 fumarylacetoacetase [Flavobacteriales bacterium]
MMIPANDPALRSWVPVPTGSDFPIQNLPLGVGAWNSTAAVPLTRIGDRALDLSVLAEAGLLDGLGIAREAFDQPALNPLMAAGKAGVRALRQRLSDLLRDDNPVLRDDNTLREDALVAVDQVVMQLPVVVGDYTDFYSSRQHAYNVGCMFRDPANALLPNWLHLPVGYHGRASSIVVSGTPIRRPMGQYKPGPDAAPVFGATRQLDMELEVGFITFDGNALGDRISTAEAEDHILGLVLFNDWSARDIQAWEYVPLGPFLGKNFGSSISPWVVLLDALEPFRVPSPVQDPPVLPYLQQTGDRHFEIALEAGIATADGRETVICRSNFKHLYWSMAQQLAHHTVNGCNVRSGDVMASGTISGDTEDSFGSLLELTWKGTKPLTLHDGSERKFLEDGDTLVMRGHAERNGVRIGFGEVRGTVLPALPYL